MGVLLLGRRQMMFPSYCKNQPNDYSVRCAVWRDWLCHCSSKANAIKQKPKAKQEEI